MVVFLGTLFLVMCTEGWPTSTKDFTGLDPEHKKILNLVC